VCHSGSLVCTVLRSGRRCSGIRHRLRQQLSPRRQFHQSRRPGSQAVEVRRCDIDTGTPGVVSVIDLDTSTVIATIPLPLSINPLTPTANGHPNYIAVTSGTPTGKVYVTSADSNFMTIIRTDTDVVDLTVSLQGNGVSVRITQH
jgi:hypothetical protein